MKITTRRNPGLWIKQSLIMLFALTYLGSSTIAYAEDNIETTADTVYTPTIAEDSVLADEFNTQDYQQIKALYLQTKSNALNDNAVSEQERKDFVNELLKNYPEYHSNGHQTVSPNDYIAVSMYYYINGEKEYDASVDNYVLPLGKKIFPSQIENSIIGKNKGCSIKFSVNELSTEQSDTNSNNKISVAETNPSSDYVIIKINDIDDAVIYTYDTLTDSYVNATFGCKSVDDFLNKMQFDMTIYAKSSKLSNQVKTLVKTLKSSSYSVPSEYLKRRAEQEKEIGLKLFVNNNINTYNGLLASSNITDSIKSL